MRDVRSVLGEEMIKIKKSLAVGDRVRLRGYSYAGKVVEGCVGTVTELRHPDELDVEVQVTDLGKVLVYPSQCRRLVRKPKERVWTLEQVMSLVFEAELNQIKGILGQMSLASYIKHALETSND